MHQLNDNVNVNSLIGQILQCESRGNTRIIWKFDNSSYFNSSFTFLSILLCFWASNAQLLQEQECGPRRGEGKGKPLCKEHELT